MVSRLVVSGVLLMAAPLFSQTDPWLKAGMPEPAWFQLTEDGEQVVKLLGKPANVVEFGKDFVSWQFQIGAGHDDFSHVAVFRKSEGKLISITREYEPESDVDALFPPAETTACFFPDAVKPKFAVRVRRLSGGRLLMAMGTSKPGQRTGQLLLIRETELGNFYSWIAAQLSK